MNKIHTRNLQMFVCRYSFNFCMMLFVVPWYFQRIYEFPHAPREVIIGAYLCYGSSLSMRFFNLKNLQLNSFITVYFQIIGCTESSENQILNMIICITLYRNGRQKASTGLVAQCVGVGLIAARSWVRPSHELVCFSFFYFFIISDFL